MLCEPEEKINSLSGESKANVDLLPEVPGLRSLYLYISGSCNLACRHCWITPDFQEHQGNGRFIDLPLVEKAILEAKKLGLRSVKLTGGEPMLHPRFREIVALINDQDLNMVAETNGMLVSPEIAKFLKSQKHFSFISVSLDGSDSKTHDYLRGVSGSFDKVREGIRNLVDAGFRPQLICTLHQGNVSQMEDVIRLAESMGCGSVKFNHVQKVGRGEKFFFDQGLNIQEIIEIYKKVEKDIIPQCKLKIHFDIPFAFHSIRRLLKDSGSRCTVLNILGVLSSGDLSLCGIGETVPELVFGNIEQDCLKEVWNKSEGLKELRELIPSKLEGICKNCIHKDICLGTCIANNYYSTGKLNAGYLFCSKADELGLFPRSRKR